MTAFTPLPRNNGSRAIEAALEEHGLPSDSTTRASLHPCQGARFHSPRPLMVRAYDVGFTEAVFLCSICKDNLDVLVHLSKSYDDDELPWTIKREFGNQLRTVAKAMIDDDE